MTRPTDPEVPPNTVYLLDFKKMHWGKHDHRYPISGTYRWWCPICWWRK